jgi:hypothetical protein
VIGSIPVCCCKISIGFTLANLSIILSILFWKIWWLLKCVLNFISPDHIRDLKLLEPGLYLWGRTNFVFNDVHPNDHGTV